MASGAVWGIDIGQCALKALRCQAHEDSDKIVADAFDYIEYPKILSQPGSDPAELIGEALKLFLSRNSVWGDRVAVSVPGQAGLARFIKLPPVEAKKIPDLVHYEARQQIPFDLNDVIWDYQRMGGGSEEEGFALEPVVGLFAMKRDAVFRALDPFLKAGIEVDIVQLTPLVLYNFLLFDQLHDLPPPDEFDPENPPKSLVIISVGTDATDLVISNGYRVWQRPIPLGGSHFTKALTKELKLTFAKAEHLKRNASAAADSKAVFQAMRPVINDLLTELQRSISYFSNLDRAAEIGRVIALGNAMKLPGLRRFLSQQLGFEIERLESYRGLTGPQVVSAPSFQENLLSFAVPYGLALQGLAKGGVRTNLLPKELLYDRLVKRKKPWAVAAAAMLLLGCAASFTTYALALGKVDETRWKTAESQASQLASMASGLKSQADQAGSEFDATDQIGQHLVGNVDGRVRWLELLKAINSSLPSDLPRKPDDPLPPIPDRNELHVTNLECQPMEDVGAWYEKVKQHELTPAAEAKQPAAAGNGSGNGVGNGAMDDSAMARPTGPGWIVRIVGYHYHNADRTHQGIKFVQETLLKGLQNGKLKLSTDEPGRSEEVTMRELGISHPILVNPQALEPVELHDPNATSDGRSGAGSDLPAGKPISLQRFDFDIQFCWQPKTPKQRSQAKKEKAEAGAPAAQP